MTWETGDSTKNILGYECIQAQTDYHGRHWTVWFTPEIPVHDGPWKFRGLPGLILEATTGDGIGFLQTESSSLPKILEVSMTQKNMNDITERIFYVHVVP